MSWGWRSWRSGSNPVRQAWCVGWLIRTTGVIGLVRARVIRRLVHVLFGWRPTTLSWLGPGRPGCSTWSRAAPKPRLKRGWRSVPKAWCDGVDVVAMDGFTGFTTAASEEVPTATAVMDPFHAVRLARDALDQCRRRAQQRTPRARQLPPQNAPHCRRTPPQR